MSPAFFAAAATAAAAAPAPNQKALVLHADILILAVIACFTLFHLPRAIARFSDKSEWMQGHIFHSVKVEPTRATNFKVEASYMPTSDKAYAGSQDSHSAYSSVTYLGQFSSLKTAGAPAPRHVPMLSSFIHPISSALCHRMNGYSVGQILLMAGYLGILFYGSFYESNPFTDPERAGYVITSQIPFIYAFATKNNVLGFLVGVGYEKLNFLHRFVGRIMVIGANVHALGYIYKWTLASEFTEKISEPYVRWGFVALVCFDLLGFLSVSIVRSTSYNLFFTTHAVSLVVLLPAVCYHEAACIPYVIAASVLYALDHVCRLIKTRFTSAKIRPLPELGVTRVEMPGLNAGWRAGQHVRLRVLSSGMGLWGWSECHPFTIASVSRTPEGMVLMCKKAGRWTNKLYSMASTPSYGEAGKEVGRNVSVMVEGPYGGVGHTVMSSYSGAMFVVGGSGVTFALSAAQDLISSGSSSRVKVIEIVWTVQDPSSLTPMLPLLASLVQQSTSARVKVSVFYTRAIPISHDEPFFPPGITLSTGRPKIGRILDSVIGETVSSGNGGSLNGVFVGVCGPAALADNVSKVVKNFDSSVRKAVGGVELHEEVFGW